MELINSEQIKALNITKREIFEWIGESIALKDESYLPPKISMKPEGHIFYNVMPCIIPKLNVVGVKIVNRYPDNTPCLKSQLSLYDLKNGDMLSLMSADYITTMRTGAVAVHSIKTFALCDFSTLALIGLGNVGRATLEIFAAVFTDKQYTVKLFKYKDHAEKIIKDFAEFKNLKFQIFDNIEDLIRGSDVIVSGVTYAEKDFCGVENYKEGVTVIPIHTLGFQNCDTVFDKVFGDDYGHIKDFKYFNEFKSFGEVAKVVKGQISGRDNDKQRILCYNIGIALHDVFFAKKIYDKIVKGS